MPVTFSFPSNYPIAELKRLEKELEANLCVVPSYLPPSVGKLNFMALAYQKNIEQLEIQILPDLNIVLRIARAAKGNINFDRTSRIAFHLAALAHLTDLQFEPSIAIHELAHQQGHKAGLELLRDFRAADNAPAEQWLDLSKDVKRELQIKLADAEVPGDLSAPLRRWKMNRLAILKIAALELNQSLSHRSRMEAFIRWMREEYFLAGPAALLATMYFAPSSPRSDLLKKLRSAVRSRAIEGINNESWDLTHLSDFANKATGGLDGPSRYLFASTDQKLCVFASLMLHRDEAALAKATTQALQQWWPYKDAFEIASRLVESVLEARDRTISPLASKGSEWLVRETATLEAVIYSWRP
ncbi:hypothetical protein [Cypionkella sp.]|uniref:hypothetical protein n=1 Tax=Cypionkella sp. TaxID=2811411 RepID=UPI002ABA2ABC|nr:hypothetical protein [Cypionkella sp.]MDZ4393283.1 hypothetical protein [Cypionkella sp.]